MENFMAYANQTIEFDDAGCFVITGENLDKAGRSNGSGKSSIFWAITMALYNQARGKTLGESIRIGTESCILELILQAEDKRYYKIRRTRNKRGSSTTFLFVSNSKDFKKKENIAGDTQDDTQKKINAIMKMDYTSFCHSVYFKEDESSIFAQSTKSVRFNIIKNSLQIDKYDKYTKKAKQDLEAVVSELATLSESISSVDELENELKENISKSSKCKESVANLNNNLGSIDNRISKIHKEISGVELSLSKINSAEVEKKEAANVLSEIETQINNVRNRIHTKEREISEYRKSLGFLKDQLHRYEDERAKIKLFTDEEITKLETSAENIKEQILLNKSKISSEKRKIELLSSSIQSETSKCTACGKPLSDKEAKSIIRDSESLISLAESANLKLEPDLSSTKQALKASSSNYKLSVSLDSKIASIKSEAKAIVKLGREAKRVLAELDFSELEKKKKVYSNKVNSLIQSIKEMRDDVEDIILRKETLKAEIDSLKFQKNKVLGEIASFSRQIGEFNHRQSEIKKTLRSIKVKKARISELWDKRTVIENMISACSKKGGIPSILISRAIVEIEKYTNTTLETFDNYDSMKVRMTTPRPDEIDIAVRMGNEVEYRDFDTFSGGERFIISFAIRMALAQILSRKYGANIKFILLDEAGTALDEYNTERFADMVKRLSADQLILLITHQDNLRNFIQQNIFVRRSAGKSEVIVNSSGSVMT